MKRLMILGAGELQLPAIVQAKQLGFETVVADQNPDAPGMRAADFAVQVSTIDEKGVLKCAQEYHVDGIMTLATDFPIRTVAKVAERLGLEAISSETAHNATDKYKMRECLRRASIPCPDYYRITSRHELEKLVADGCVDREQAYILKPTDNAGSRGVIMIPAGARDHFYEEAYRYSIACSRCGELILESFLDGKEISVETFSVDGACHIVQITDKTTTEAPHFVEYRHVQPAALSDGEIGQIEDMVSRAVRAIGIFNGPSHTEVRLTKDGPRIVEIGARLAGDHISTDLVKLSTGIDLVECCIRQAMRMDVNLKRECERGAAIRYFREKPGIIRSIQGIEDAKRQPGIFAIHLERKPGERIQEVHSSLDRIGYVIASGHTAQEAVSRCEGAVDSIEIEVEEE